MASTKPRLLIRGLPLLLPLLARCVPAPWDPSTLVLRRQLDTAVVTSLAETYTTATSMVVPAPTNLPERVLSVPPDGGGLALLSPSTSSASISPPATSGLPSPFSPAPPPPSNPDANTSALPSSLASAPLVMAYYPDYLEVDFPPENIDFSRFDWIDFAFAVPDQALNLNWDGSDNAPDLLRRLVSRAHAYGKRVKLSVGGWAGSQFFSSAAATAQNRTVLADNILALYEEYSLDGIDIDWEYPAQEGNGGNVVSPDDSANFLAFLHTLRDALPPDAVITAATQTVPFADADGNPMLDVSDFARVLDWVLIMNYDTWGSSSKPGPNAPLSDACNNSTQERASALSALQVWTAAGFSPAQLVLGVPSYGYISRSSAMTLQARASDDPASGSGSDPGSGSGSGSGDSSSARSSRFSRTSRMSRSFHTWRRTFFTSLGPDPDSSSSSPSAHSRRTPEFMDWVNSSLSEFSDFAQTAAAGSGAVRAKNDDGTTDDGQVQFRALVKQGILQGYPSTPSPHVSSNGINNSSGSDASPVPASSSSSSSSDSTNTPPDSADTFGGTDPGGLGTALEDGEPRTLFAGGAGFVRRWDGCSSTPYLRSAGARQVVTYDDPVSLEMKAQLVRQAGMRGVNMFDVHGDTDAWDLTDALRRGLGLV